MHKQQKVGVITSVHLETKLTRCFHVASSSIYTDYKNSLTVSTHLLSDDGTFGEKHPGQQPYRTSQSECKLQCAKPKGKN